MSLRDDAILLAGFIFGNTKEIPRKVRAAMERINTSDATREARAEYQARYVARRKRKEAQNQKTLAERMNDMKDIQYIGKRDPGGTPQFYPGDWPDIEAMIAAGRTRKDIAEDYGVSIYNLDKFIAQNQAI